MRAGRQRYKVDIEEVTETQNEFGEPVETWSAFISGIRAYIKPLRGKEFFDAAQTQAEVDTEIGIRYRDGITPKMRVKEGSRIYTIYAVLPDEKRRSIKLMCKDDGSGT